MSSIAATNSSHDGRPTRAVAIVRSRGLWAMVLLAVHAGLLAHSAAWQSPTSDEPGHLVAGLWYWQTGRFDGDPGNPPLFGAIAALPVLAAGYEDGSSGPDFAAANGPRIFRLTTLGRWALIPISLLGGWICYRWSQELFGTAAGLLALLLWCFNPMVLANGQLITGDMSAAALGVAAFYLFWKWLNDPAFDRALAAGLALGLALLAKFVWLVLLVYWPAVWALWRLSMRGERRIRLRREAAQFAAILLVGLYLVNAGYGFDGSFQPLKQHRLDSTLLQSIVGEVPQNASAGLVGVLAEIPLPLPAGYVRGIDAVLSVKESPYRPTYLRGERREGGWWDYYVYGLFVKQPLGLWALALLAAVLLLANWDYSAGWRTELLLAVTVCGLLAFVTWTTSVQFVRYALPIVPFLAIWISRCGRTLTNGPRLAAGLTSLATAAAISGSLAVYPHSGSYFNLWAGGPSRGHEHLLSSDFDWGQNLLYLKEWYDGHPEARPLFVAYTGRVDPQAAGIECEPVPTINADRPRGGLKPGWYAISVNHLMDEHPRFEPFREMRPVAKVGYSIWIYRVDRRVIRDSP